MAKRGSGGGVSLPVSGPCEAPPYNATVALKRIAKRLRARARELEVLAKTMGGESCEEAHNALQGPLTALEQDLGGAFHHWL